MADVSGLFPDVLKNMQTEDLEQKKLVYLYLMNYAKTQPELVILAVNTFVRDAEDSNPLVRALAIRTMGCLRAEKIIDYLCDPLQKCLRDDDPYVRKTAALCVAKLYDLKPELVMDNGFLEQLREMVSDPNPMVSRQTIVFLYSLPRSFLQGCCKHDCRFIRHPFCISCRRIGRRSLHHRLFSPSKTPDCPERVFRVGKGRHPERVGSI